MDENRMLNPALSDDFAARKPAAMRRIQKALSATNGNLSATARELNISVDTLRRWIKKAPELAEARDNARIAAIKEGRG